MKFRSNMPPAATMQMAPMIDIVFLLLIFFIVTWDSQAREKDIDVSVPAADEGKERERVIGEIIVNIRADGTIVLDRQEITEAQLFSKLATIVANYNADQAVILRGDEKTAYNDVIGVLDTCQKAGIWNIAFATRSKEDVPAPGAPGGSAGGGGGGGR